MVSKQCARRRSTGLLKWTVPLFVITAAMATLPVQPALTDEPSTPIKPGLAQTSSASTEDVIVVLEASGRTRAAARTETLDARYEMSVGATYSQVFDGFAASLPSGQVAALRRDPNVAGVYPDRVVKVSSRQRTPAGIQRVRANVYNRINLGAVNVDGDIAFLDTGVSRHPDLNVYRSVYCTSDDGCTRAFAPDRYGHGTAVAGVAAAIDNHRGVVGTAPGARIWNVRVTDRFGVAPTSSIVAGLDWVTARASRVEVANVSIAGNSSRPMKLAVARATDAGVVVVVAAGNGSARVRYVSPANAPSAITVSGFVDTDGRPGGHGPRCKSLRASDDAFYPYSNFGRLVDIAAPAGCVRSTIAGGGYAKASGTSFSAPHVAGAALVWINKEALSATPNRAALVGQGLRGPWGKPQNGPCGFRGGKSDEPVLVMGPCKHGSE